jgi:hypothetical protein
MSDSPHTPDSRTRTGEFFFQVSRRNGETWNWRLRIEALGTGEWETFESMQEALWFIRQHLTVDEDAEADEALPLDSDADSQRDCLEDGDDTVDLLDAAE